MTHDPMTADQFRWFLVLVTGGVSAIWFLSDARKLIRTGRQDGGDPSVRDRRFGYTMGLLIATIGMVGSAKLQGWISWGATATTPVPAPAAMKFDPVEVRRVLQDLAGGQVFVLSATEPFDYATVAKTAAAIDPDVHTAEPFVYANVVVHHGALAITALMKGVSPVRFKNNVEKYFIEGTLPPYSTEQPSIAIGKELATLLGVHVGDELELEVPPVAARTVRISAIHDTQFPEYEFHLVVTTMPTAQALIGKADAATGIELELGHEDQAQRIAKALAAKLGAGFKVFDWCELNQKFLGCTWQ